MSEPDDDTDGLGAARRLAEAALRRWRRLTIRRRILIAAAALNLAAIAAAGLVVVLNARIATGVEIDASLDAAARFTRETVSELRADVTPEALHAALTAGTPARHVRFAVFDRDGRPVTGPPVHAIDDDDHEEAAPDWFAQVIGVEAHSLTIPVVVAGQPVATVVLTGEPADEIAEVWQDARALGLIALVVNVAVLLVLSLAIGRALAPLAALARGLSRLEEGDYRARLPRPPDDELAVIADHFNALAEQLALTRAENRRLSLRLVSVQDDERRVVAGELHDEVGPCLFGITANARSIEAMAKASRAAKAADIGGRAREIADIADRLKTMNRRLLHRLRPMSLGHVPLADVASGLVQEFRRMAPAVVFDLALGELEDSYGEPVDLTVYRCLQECLTNAVKHAEPRIVMIELAQRGGAGGSERRLHLQVEDDGFGMDSDTPAGYGLTGIAERARALGGHLAWGAGTAGGTRFEIELPLAGEDAIDPATGGAAKGGMPMGFGERVR